MNKPSHPRLLAGVVLFVLAMTGLVLLAVQVAHSSNLPALTAAEKLSVREAQLQVAAIQNGLLELDRQARIGQDKLADAQQALQRLVSQYANAHGCSSCVLNAALDFEKPAKADKK